jgi:hypothetical protein
MAPLLVAAAVSTVTAVVPTASAGEVAVTVLSEITVKAVAAVVPKNTSRVLIKPAPVMVTIVSPPIGPEAGLIEPITGDGTKLKLSELFVPPGEVILIGTMPTTWAGVTTSTSVSLVTVKLVAGAVPNFTPVVPLRLVPVMVTLLPPDATPAEEKTAVGAGAAM